MPENQMPSVDRLPSRAVRRRARKEAVLREVYQRLVEIDDADDLLLNCLTELGLSLAECNSYMKTHRMVGPGATSTRDYVVIWLSPRDVRVDRKPDETRRYCDTNVHSLEDVLREPWYVETLGERVIDDIADVAVVNPASAALQAQTMLRRKGRSESVVVFSEFNRSKKACANTINKFAVTVGTYEDQIGAIVEGNWITMRGPDGDGDWEITAPLCAIVAARDLYSIAAVAGLRKTLLLFENELSVLNILLSPSLNRKSSGSYLPYCGGLASPDTLSGFKQPISVLQAEHNRVLSSLEPNYRERARDLLRSVVSIEKGVHYATAVSIGVNMALTASHVPVSEIFSTTGVRETVLDDDITVLLGLKCDEIAWNFREPVVGEVCCYLYHREGQVMLSEEVVVFEVSKVDKFFSTSRPKGVLEGNSGTALISLSDFSLVGILQGRAKTTDLELICTAVSADLFWKLALSSELEGQQTDVYEGFRSRGLRLKFNDVADALTCDDDGTNFLRLPTGWMYELVDGLTQQICSERGSPGVSLDILVEGKTLVQRIARSSGHLGSVTIRNPRLGEPCVVVNKGSDDRVRVTRVVTVSHLNSLTSLSRDYGTARSGVVLALSDCALIGYVTKTSNRDSFSSFSTIDVPMGELDTFVNHINVTADIKELLLKDVTMSVDIFRTDNLVSHTASHCDLLALLGLDDGTDELLRALDSTDWLRRLLEPFGYPNCFPRCVDDSAERGTMLRFLLLYLQYAEHLSLREMFVAVLRDKLRNLTEYPT